MTMTSIIKSVENHIDSLTYGTLVSHDVNLLHSSVVGVDPMCLHRADYCQPASNPCGVDPV